MSILRIFEEFIELENHNLLRNLNLKITIKHQYINFGLTIA